MVRWPPVDSVDSVSSIDTQKRKKKSSGATHGQISYKVIQQKVFIQQFIF
jgi:hypothetical protein